MEEREERAVTIAHCTEGIRRGAPRRWGRRADGATWEQGSEGLAAVCHDAPPTGSPTFRGRGWGGSSWASRRSPQWPGLFQSPAYVTLRRFCGPPNVANATLRRVRAAHNADVERGLPQWPTPRVRYPWSERRTQCNYNGKYTECIEGPGVFTVTDIFEDDSMPCGKGTIQGQGHTRGTPASRRPRASHARMGRAAAPSGPSCGCSETQRCRSPRREREGGTPWPLCGPLHPSEPRCSSGVGASGS